MPDYTTKAPGVYIEEIPATGPIAGVGTSTAAFIGPALFGQLNSPLKITNWTQFRDAFGLTKPPYIASQLSTIARTVARDRADRQWLYGKARRTLARCTIDR